MGRLRLGSRLLNKSPFPTIHTYCSIHHRHLSLTSLSQAEFHTQFDKSIKTPSNQDKELKELPTSPAETFQLLARRMLVKMKIRQQLYLLCLKYRMGSTASPVIHSIRAESGSHAFAALISWRSFWHSCSQLSRSPFYRRYPPFSFIRTVHLQFPSNHRL